MTLKPLLAAGLIALAVASCGTTKSTGHMVTETYTVQQGDTLWTIGETYIQKNTGGRRYLPEFVSGIQELNDDLLHHDRQPGTIYPGDVLRINYFVK